MRIWRLRAGLTVKAAAADRQHLAALVADRNSLQKHVRQAPIVLLTADSYGTPAIKRCTDTSKMVVWRSIY